MKTYEKPTVVISEIQAEYMLAVSNRGVSQKAFQSGESVLSNGRRNVWSNGWDD